MQEHEVLQSQLRRYVLGELSSEEQRQIEQAYFADETLLQQVWAIFDEMVEQLWQGELSTAEARRMTVRVQASPYLQARMETQVALSRAIANLAQRPPRITRPWTLFAGRPAHKWMWATAGVGVLVGNLFWLFSARPLLPQHPASQVAQVQSSPATPPLPSATVTVPALTPSGSLKAAPTAKTVSVQVAHAITTTFFLAQESVRAVSDPTPFALPPQATVVELQIEVRPPLASHYRVEVATATGEVVVARTHLGRQHLRDLSFVTMRLPARQLSEQHYVARIQAENSSASPPERHSFQIEKKIATP